MNGGQDLGGMMGFGAIAPEAHEPIFHGEWEKRALALTLAAGACGEWNIDIGRHARETIAPAQYLSKSYYDIWITALEKLLLRNGMVASEELTGGRVLTPPRAVKGKLLAGNVAQVLARGAPYNRAAPAPARFAAGDRVRTLNMNPETHTRLPRYARGKTGVIENARGCFVYPDSNAHGRGEDPRWCYTLRFSGTELWGAGCDPQLNVSIDAWEPYLERA